MGEAMNLLTFLVMACLAYTLIISMIITIAIQWGYARVVIIGRTAYLVIPK